MNKARSMTNQEYMIAALTGQIDDDGVGREAVIYYNIGCPYRIGDPRAHCFGTFELAGDRAACVACKEEWLESEVDE